MLRKRPLLPLLLIVLAGAAPPSPSGEHAAFLSPQDGAILVGPTEFRFAVHAAAGVDRIDVYVDGRLVGTAREPRWRIAWDAPAGLIGIPVVAAVYSADGLLETLRLTTSEATFDDEVQVVAVELFPVVTDRRGHYVKDLGREAFTVWDQGRRVAIETFANEATSLSLAVVIDNSNSMEAKLGLVQEASSRFLDSLEEIDRVAVYSFNHAVHRHLAFTADREAAKATVQGFAPGGGTALFDALVHVMHDLSPLAGRKAVVLFSDGRDERSITSLDRVVEVARMAEVIVYAVGAGESSADLEARPDLEALASATGGRAHFIDKLRHLPRIYDAILADLRAQYSIGYTPPPGPPGQRRVAIEVSDPKLSVRCRESYFHPGSE